MLIRIKKTSDIKPSEITGESVFYNRRSILRTMGLGIAGLATNVLGNTAGPLPTRHIQQVSLPHRGPAWLVEKVKGAVPGLPSTEETPTPWNYVTGYNNFYEFGWDKTDPAENAKDFVTDPWRLEIGGQAELTGKFDLEDILAPHALEERIYRLRCVEAWSMVVPWVGFPLGDLLKRFKPTSDAKWVRFETLYDPEQMPEQRSRWSSIDYPYVEGLRIDEAMNELAFLAVGVYGRAMPNQNGAPIRLVVPWKYGFKSIKSIVKIEFTKRRPRTTWQKTLPEEYGFYANVNPNVDHPRWSQASERRLPSSLFSPNVIDTRMFNGYEEQVAHLYNGMDLSRQY
jgi:sulfoxide reductase catalytic subunit YedY